MYTTRTNTCRIHHLLIMFCFCNLSVFYIILKAPCEAEAQCATLVKSGKVWATGTEDMDSLTFGSDVVLRHLTFSEARYIAVAWQKIYSLLFFVSTLPWDEFTKNRP